MDTMLYSRPSSTSKKSSDLKGKSELMWMGSVGKELDHLEKERAIHTDPEETRRRRTIKLLRQDAHSSWGFTLQTYYIRHKKTGQMEVITYVDYVELNSSAYIAGMRRGDVLLSVNGESAEGITLKKLVEKIQKSDTTLWLVVLFEDCCRKVELYQRFIKLKNILAQKSRELHLLNKQEQLIKEGGRLSRLGSMRGSIRSSVSSADWDTYSEVAAAEIQDSDTVVFSQRVWHRQKRIAGSTDTLDTLSDVSFSSCPSPFGSSGENLTASRGLAATGSSALLSRRTSSLQVLSSSSANSESKSPIWGPELKAKRVSSDSDVTVIPMLSAKKVTGYGVHTAKTDNVTSNMANVEETNHVPKTSIDFAEKHIASDTIDCGSIDESDLGGGACGGEIPLVSENYYDSDLQAQDDGTATLRKGRQMERFVKHAEDEESIPLAGRRCSNTALLHDMRMKLLADDVSMAAVHATKEKIEVSVSKGSLPDMEESSRDSEKENLAKHSEDKNDSAKKTCNSSYNSNCVEDVETPIYTPTSNTKDSIMTENSAAFHCSNVLKNNQKDVMVEDKHSENYAMDAFDITVVMDEENIICRLYKGIRINDTTEDTRL